MIDILLALGYKLVPVDGKRPRVANWPTHDFTSDEITHAEKTYSDFGVGIKLENLLDFDGDGPDAAAVVESLNLPESVAWQSARGRHELFRLTQAQVEFFSTAGKIKFGDLELRTGVNSQSVLPPAAGRKWLKSFEDTELVILPDSVFEDIKSRLPKPKEIVRDETTEYTPPENRRPGDVFNESVSWDDVLVPHDWSHVGGDKWCRPGKHGEISATTGYCASEVRGELFYCFSTSDEVFPVEPEKAYSKFELWACLNHGGDFRIAAAAAARSGYSPDNDTSCSEFLEDGDFPELENEPEQENKVKPALPAKAASKSAVACSHPRLNLTQFNDPLTNYCLALEHRSAADVGAIWFQINEIFANFLGRNPHFIWSGKSYYTNGSVFIIGPTATGKKGLSLSAAKAPFNSAICGEFSDDIEFATYEPLMAGGYQSGQAILTHFMKDKDDVGEKDKRLLMTEQESASLMKMAKVENSILSQVMRTAFDGDKLEYRVSKIKGKDATVSINDAHVSLIGHITGDELLQVLTKGSDKTGELNRIQFVLCLDSKFVSEKKSNFLYQDIPELAILRQHVLECYKWAAKRRILFTEPLHELLDDYTEQHELNLRSGKEKPVNARLTLYLRKWIARFAVLDMTDIATVSHYERAMSVIRYIRAANEFILGEWLDGVDKDLIDKAILTVGESQGGATRAQIGRELFGSHWTVEKVEGVLSHARKRLELSGKTVKEKRDRNKIIYHL